MTVDNVGTTVLPERGNLPVSYAAGGAGPPILLIHNFAGDRTLFTALTGHLAASFTVVTYDQRDSGLSGDSTAPYDRADLADDAAALLVALGYERAHVFGTSLGGTIAQALAIRHPGLVDHLILNNTFDLRLDSAEASPAATAAAAARPRERRDDAGLRGLAEWGFPAAFIDRHPEVLDLYRNMAKGDPHRRARRAPLLRGVTADPASIVAPTLLVAGAADRTVPPDRSAELARRIRGARVVRQAGTGHFAVVQDPGGVADAITGFAGGAP